jgi:hypothetical protein
MTKQFLTPLVSCIYCRKKYSAKGIFSHFFAKHDPLGGKIMETIRKKGTDATFRNPNFYGQYKKLDVKTEHPCFNSECSNLTKTKFCSRHCSVVIANKNRTKEVYEKQAKTLSKTLLENKLKLGWVSKEKPYSSVPLKQRICSVCSRVDETRRYFQSDKCMFCNDSLTYREACRFTFNLKDYPTEFDLSLLAKQGMFNPKTNKTGVSRDHRLSISTGKDNRVDPKIMSHPANCQLMLHSENKKKQHHSSITLQELMCRIDEWDKKYKDAESRHDLDSAGL